MASHAYVASVVVHEGQIREIGWSHGAHDVLSDAVSAIASEMRRGAPVRTGAGRGSIVGRVRTGPDGWIGTASWDEPHYYMGIQNSRKQFAEPALARVRYV